MPVEFKVRLVVRNVISARSQKVGCLLVVARITTKYSGTIASWAMVQIPIISGLGTCKFTEYAIFRLCTTFMWQLFLRKPITLLSLDSSIYVLVSAKLFS